MSRRYVVDHLNNNTLDNRKINLKICTQSENSLNRLYSKRNSSGCVGVKFDKRSKLWIVYIRIMGKTKYLCYSRDRESAIKARKIADEYIILGEIDKVLNMECIKVQTISGSGYRGVYKLKNKDSWQVSYKGRHLGTFHNIDDAIKARKYAEDNY